MKLLAALFVIPAALFAAACSKSSDKNSDSGGNQACTSYCFSLNGIEGDTPEQVDAKVKAMCADMGRKGKPDYTERTKSFVAGHCSE